MRRATRILKGSATYDDRFFSDHRELEEALEALRQLGCAIVFTTGVWDLFHIGHADYIAKGREEAAKLLPDAEHLIMVVGVDSDELTRARKGTNRPIVPEEERLHVLGHIRSVDILVLQYELNQLYSIVRPEVLVVSSSTKDLPGDMQQTLGPYCGQFCVLPPQALTSTTERIRKLTIDGAGELAKQVQETIHNFLRGGKNAP